MDLNRFSYYRANPFANNDFIPLNSMANRKKKQFPSQIPQGEQHISSKPGKRIFRDKVQENQIQKEQILQSPEKYPFQNRIALDKNYRRNLDTIDIQGATAGTKVSQSIRNKHKALQQLRRRNQQQIKSPLLGESLDQVYQKKRKQMAEKIQKNIEMRKTKDSLTQNQNHRNEDSLQNSRTSNNYQKEGTKISQSELQAEYERYVAHNSNKKYTGITPNVYEFKGFQRYRRPEGSFQTLDSYNNGRIPEAIPMQRFRNDLQNNRYSSIDMGGENSYNSVTTNTTNQRGTSLDFNQQNNNMNSGSPLNGRETSYMNNGYISINNRHRSNPEYIDKFPSELQKRLEETQKNKQMEESIRSSYQNDKAEFRRHNPTNLSFNIAAKSTLMGPIV